MEHKKEMEEMLKGIEEEIKKLEREKDHFPDYENRVLELGKEAEALKKDLEKH